MSKSADKKPVATFKSWYKEKGAELNRKRRERYRDDPSYRERVKAQAQASRARGPVDEPPLGYPNSFEDVREQLGVSTWALRDWRRRGYFPDPVKQSQKLYFSDKQVRLLQKLKDFLDAGGGRKYDELETLKNMVFMNWED